MAKQDKSGTGRPRLSTDGLSPQQIAKRESARARAETTYYGDNPKLQWAKAALRDSRRRAKKRSREHTITLQDLIDLADQTDICAMTGIELDYRRGEGCRANSATVDRIDPNGAYTRDNIQVICRDANMSKARLTLEQIAKMGAWANARRQTDLRNAEDHLAESIAAFSLVVEKFETVTARRD